MQYGVLLEDDQQARKVSAQAVNIAVVDGVVYLVDVKRGSREMSCGSESFAEINP